MGPSVIVTKWSAISEETGQSQDQDFSNNNTHNKSHFTNGIGHMTQKTENNSKMGDCMIRIQNGCKAYGSNVVLNQLNMNVERGTIYSLLGASGCGKTTLLACIVGTRSLDMGDIVFCGESMDSIIEDGGLRNRVGYMPQELALYKEFTIKEALLYFGRIFGMSNTYISQQTHFLIKFLQLPSEDSLIRQLSGGQQRRTSFAVALLHGPQLLVLDEPTVGVDPILRRSIWEHLRSLVNAGKTTVIITTHYIEEARNADTVGMLRSGRILTEGAPDALLEAHSCPSLEELFLNLSLIDETVGKPNDSTKPADENSKTTSKLAKELCQKFTPSKCWSSTERRGYFNRLRALALKNIVTTYRQSAYIFSFLLLPAIEILLSCWAFGNEPRNLHFGVVNLEIQRINSNLSYADQVTCGYYLNNRTCDNFLLSCDYIEALEKSETLSKIKQFSTHDEALNSVHNGETLGFLTIPSHFTRLSLEKSMAGLYADNETVFNSRVQIDMDMSETFASLTVKGTLFETFRVLMKSMLVECEPTYAPEVIDGPLLFNEPIYGKDNQTSVTEFIISGLLLIVMYFAAISLTGMSYVLEKKYGMLERTIVAGVSTTEIITAQLLAQSIILIIQIIICLFVVFGVFKIPMNGQVGFVMLLVLLQGALGMLAGIALSSMCDEETVVMQVSIALTVPSVILGGIFWPLTGMPTIAQYIAVIFVPQTMANESLRSMLIRNWGIAHPSVWPGFGITIAWLILLWFVAIIFAKRSVSPSNR